MLQETQTKSLAVPVLAVLLVVAAFLIGNLWTKVNYLEKQETPKVLAGETEAGGEDGLKAGELSAIPPVSERDHIRGNPNAQILLVEYSDFECPYCKSFHSTMKQVLTEYKDQVAWVYRHFPLSSHANAQKEAEAAECAAQLGGDEAFWSYADTLFKRTEGGGTGFAQDQLVPLAQELGLDGSLFKDCLDSGRHSQYVKDSMAGGENAGIGGTPGTVLLTKDGRRESIPGALPFETVKQIVEANLTQD